MIAWGKETEQLAQHLRGLIGRPLPDGNVCAGIAAPQLRLGLRVCAFVRWDGEVLVLFNPEIVDHAEHEQTATERCLSLPGIELPIRRYVDVTIAARSAAGSPTGYRLRGLEARLAQHELDHLDGMLITDRAELQR